MRNRLLRQKNRGEHGGDSNLGLIELVRLRIAQIHHRPESMKNQTEALRTLGESNERLLELQTWRSSNLFDSRERAALAMCETITMDPAQPLPDGLIPEMGHYFARGALVRLTFAIIAANDWNFFGTLPHFKEPPEQAPGHSSKRGGPGYLLPGRA